MRCTAMSDAVGSHLRTLGSIEAIGLSHDGVHLSTPRDIVAVVIGREHCFLHRLVYVITILARVWYLSVHLQREALGQRMPLYSGIRRGKGNIYIEYAFLYFKYLSTVVSSVEFGGSDVPSPARKGR